MEFRASSCVGESTMHRWLRLLPNLITSIRILLVLPISLTLVQHQFDATLWLFALAALSDAADGFLARRFGWQTEIGGILDPVADKLILASVFVILALLGYVPGWLTAMVIARDCIIILGAVSYRVWLGPVKARPSFISKLNTLCQVIFVLAVVGSLQFSWPPQWTVLSLGALVFVTVAVSGIDYVLVYGRRAAEQARARHAASRSGGSRPA